MIKYDLFSAFFSQHLYYDVFIIKLFVVALSLILLSSHSHS